MIEWGETGEIRPPCDMDRPAPYERKRRILGYATATSALLSWVRMRLGEQKDNPVCANSAKIRFTSFRVDRTRSGARMVFSRPREYLGTKNLILGPSQMRRATPQVPKFARLLIAWETRERTSSGAKTMDAAVTFDRLRDPLAVLMGKKGFNALLARALALAAAEEHQLANVKITAGGVLEGFETLRSKLQPAEFLDCRVVLLEKLLGLLVVFIGPNLTWRLVSEIWPQVLVDGMKFGN